MRRLVGLGTLAATLALSSSGLADDYLLKLDGIKGESARQKDEIDILSFSWGFSRDESSLATGSSGKPQLQRFSVQKWVDSASPQLVQALLSGKVLRTLTFTIQRSGEKGGPLLQIELKDAQVVDLHLGGSAGGPAEQRPVESVSFAFSSLTYRFFPTDKTGRAAAPVTATWESKGR